MFKDEEIVEARYWERRKRYTGIDTGIYSGEEFLEFSEMRIFDRVGVVLPTAYEDMSPEDARMKYPSEQRPQIIKTNRDGAVNFAFNRIGQKLEASQLETAVNSFARVMKRLYPTNVCLKIESGQGLYLPYASVEFTSLAVNENLYNMVAISPIGDELLMMLFNCPFETRTEWTCCIPQIRERIRDYGEEGENETN